MEYSPTTARLIPIINQKGRNILFCSGLISGTSKGGPGEEKKIIKQFKKSCSIHALQGKETKPQDMLL